MSDPIVEIEDAKRTMSRTDALSPIGYLNRFEGHALLDRFVVSAIWIPYGGGPTVQRVTVLVCPDLPTALRKADQLEEIAAGQTNRKIALHPVPGFALP